MANPQVWPHLEFFPEDAGRYLANANQAERWLKDMDANLTTLMICLLDQDFYIYEPVILIDLSYCMPIRWFKRSDRLLACVWHMLPKQTANVNGWLVLEYECFDVEASSLLASYPYFAKSFHQCGVPDPQRILGMLNASQIY